MTPAFSFEGPGKDVTAEDNGRMSAYDAAAASFDRHRALPAGVAEAIRTAVLAAIGGVPRPLLLDLGAGTGRIGWPFVAAGDAYVGVDLSFGMLRAFLERAACGGASPRLVQADGRHLPFPDATFGAVMMIQVFGGRREWKQIVIEARRALRPAGVLIVGRSALPADGIDARMKQHLAALLADMAVERDRDNVHQRVQRYLESEARHVSSVRAACWNADRTPRGFLLRHRTGARFSALPQPVKEVALRRLEDWAGTAFGSLDAVRSERHAFELKVFRF